MDSTSSTLGGSGARIDNRRARRRGETANPRPARCRVSCCPTAGRSRRPAEQVLLTDLPLNILPLADSRQALVATSGYNAHDLSLVDLESGRPSSTPKPCGRAGSGWRCRPTKDRLWWSRRRRRRLHRFTLKDGQARPRRRGRPDGRYRQGRQPQEELPQRPDARRQAERALLARHRRRRSAASSTSTGKQPERTLARRRPALRRGDCPQRLAALRLGLGRPDGAGHRSDRPARGRPRSPSASIPTRSPSIPKDDRLFVACAIEQQRRR